MPLSVESTTFTSGTSTTSLTFSHTITLANKLVVTVGIGDGASPDSVSGITFNGDALTFVAAVNDGTWTRSEIWERHTPDVVTGDVVVTFASTVVQGGAGATGFIDAATALGSPSTNTATSTDPTVTVADSASGDIVVSVMATDGSFPSTTEGGTLLWEVEDLSGDIDMNAQQQLAAGASTVCSWTNSAGDVWSAVGVAVKGALLTTNVQLPIASLWPILVAG